MSATTHTPPTRCPRGARRATAESRRCRSDASPCPSPRRGEVLLRVRATALNSADVRLMRGEPLLLRAAFGLRAPQAAGAGDGCRGHRRRARRRRVAARRRRRGRRRAARRRRPRRRTPSLPAARLVARPAALDPIAAATLPLAGGTAWQALDRGERRRGSPRARDRRLGRRRHLRRAARGAAGRRGLGAVRRAQRSDRRGARRDAHVRLPLGAAGIGPTSARAPSTP